MTFYDGKHGTHDVFLFSRKHGGHCELIGHWGVLWCMVVHGGFLAIGVYQGVFRVGIELNLGELVSSSKFTQKRIPDNQYNKTCKHYINAFIIRY